MEMAPFDLMRERGRGWQPEPNHDASSLRTGIKFDGDGDGLGERCIVFTESLRDSGRMIVPGGFEGAKGSFGECTGINLDVRWFVQGGEGVSFRCIRSIRDRGTIAPVFPVKMQELSLSARMHASSNPRSTRRGWEEGRIDAPECDRRLVAC